MRAHKNQAEQMREIFRNTTKGGNKSA